MRVYSGDSETYSDSATLRLTVAPHRVAESLMLNIMGLANAPHHWNTHLCTHWCTQHAYPIYMPPWEHLKLTTTNPKANQSLCGLIRSLTDSKHVLQNINKHKWRPLNGQRAGGTSCVHASEGAESYLQSRPQLRRSSPPEILNPQTAFHLQTQKVISERKQQTGRENRITNSAITHLL